jgi:hypothetical protein
VPLMGLSPDGQEAGLSLEGQDAELDGGRTTSRMDSEEPSVPGWDTHQEWESAMMSLLSDWQGPDSRAGGAANNNAGARASDPTTGSSLELPTPEEVYQSQSRRSLRERREPDRYGDWDGNIVHWMQAVLHALDSVGAYQAVGDSAGLNQTVSDSVRAQLVHDALVANDQWAATNPTACSGTAAGEWEAELIAQLSAEQTSSGTAEDSSRGTAEWCTGIAQ